MHFFSPSRGFQSAETPREQLGAGAVKVSSRRHRELVAAQEKGAQILAGDDGRPRISRPRDTDAARRRFARDLVKREARRRILAIAPAWRQQNDNAAIAMAAFQLGATCTTIVDAAPAIERRRALDAVREASDRLEARIDALSPAELARFDFTADAAWSLPE
jgi:hypothetical protein